MGMTNYERNILDMISEICKSEYRRGFADGQDTAKIEKEIREINVGDEVINVTTKTRRVVIAKEMDGSRYALLGQDGVSVEEAPLRKTGRHYKQIEEVLSQLEEQT